MTLADLQRRIGTPADGRWGPKTKAALLAAFTNPRAPAAMTDEIEAVARKIGCSLQQVAAVATVESRGGGFDREGRPKILFERHWFHKLTKGKWSTQFPAISNPKPGGYVGGPGEFERLCDAVRLDPGAAFASASWGKFQIMGFHWEALGYPSSFDMAHSCVSSEAAHYDMLGRFILANGLSDEMRELSPNPEACRAFARLYNGRNYEINAYHIKLAAAMR